MRFACLGFIDEDRWEALTPEARQEQMSECFRYDNVLRAEGAMVGGSCLDTACRAVTLRAREGSDEILVTDGPFTETKEVLGGILYLEARDLEHAVTLMRRHPGVKMGPFEIREQIRLSDTSEEEILALMERWSRALEAKDAAAMMEDYLPDAVLYDAVPPYKVEGRDEIRKVWQACLPFFPDRFRSEHRDLVVRVSGDLALVHGLHRVLPEPADHPCGQTWMRISVGFQRVAGGWRVAHEHVSIPFNPMTNEAYKIDDPESATAPDYSAAQPCGG